jgi:hypothetical protein
MAASTPLDPDQISLLDPFQLGNSRVPNLPHPKSFG